MGEKQFDELLFKRSLIAEQNQGRRPGAMKPNANVTALIENAFVYYTKLMYR